MVDAATPFANAAEAKKTNPQRIHWYDGADLSEENVKSIKKLILRVNQHSISGEDQRAVQDLSPDTIRESSYIENFMRMFFSSWCKNPNSVQGYDLRFLLKDARVNPDFWLDDDGTTPLMVAIYADTVKKLLDSGANPNAQTVAQRITPLMIRAVALPSKSAEAHLSSFLTLLYLPKTDLGICDKEGRDLVNYAIRSPFLRDLIIHEIENRAEKDIYRKALCAAEGLYKKETGRDLTDGLPPCVSEDLRRLALKI